MRKRNSCAALRCTTSSDDTTTEQSIPDQPQYPSQMRSIRPYIIRSWFGREWGWARMP